MNRYRVLLPLRVHTEDGSYEQHEEFEHEFSVEDEAENLRSGLLEIVPRDYIVVGGSAVYDTPPGETFTAAIPRGQEELLFQGGHIERVPDAPKPKPKPKSSADKGA
jgi:hypothetical protein